MNERPTESPSIATRITSLLLVAAGLIGTYDLTVMASKRILPAQLFYFELFAPALLLVGVVLGLKSWFRGAKLFSFKTLFNIGLVMLALGASAWWWIPPVTGYRPGGESAGMLGTIVFLLLGLPGLGLIVAAITRRSVE